MSIRAAKFMYAVQTRLLHLWQLLTFRQAKRPTASDTESGKHLAKLGHITRLAMVVGGGAADNWEFGPDRMLMLT